MSFRHPKASYRHRKPPSPPFTANVPSVTYSSSVDDLVSVSNLPALKRPRHSKSLFLPGPEELITLPGGVILTQLTTVKEPNREDDQTWELRHQRSTTPSEGDSSRSIIENSDVIPDDFNYEIEGDAPTTRQKQQRKTSRLHSNWITKVIPSLLPIYFRILRETKSLRLSFKPAPLSCTCSSFRSINVTCIYFQRTFEFSYISVSHFRINLPRC
jgi:hypothetical protein